MRRRGLAAAAVAVLSMASAAGCGGAPSQAGPVETRSEWSGACATRAMGVARTGPPTAEVETIATGLCVPWGLAFLPDGTALISERDTARILALGTDGRITEVQRIADVRPGGRPVAPERGGEGGLLGLAVSPTYATDRWVYAYYATAQDNRIARFHLGEPPQPVLTGIPVSDPVHPTVPDPNATPVVTGPAIQVPGRHAKIRRDGYRTG
jgi:glucose/arabinose dehydrogenase